MNELIQKIGGRKFVLTLVSIILIALREPLGIDEQTINKILTMALGGVGGLTVVDAAKEIKGNGTTTKS